MVKSRVLRSELKTLSPPPPPLVSFFTSHTLILPSCSPSSHPQAIMLTRIVLSIGCGQAGTHILLVLPHDVNLICIPPLYTSSLAPPQSCLCDSTRPFGTSTQLVPLLPCSLPSRWNKFCYISSRLLSSLSCRIGFLLWWRVWVSQCPSQSVMFRHKAELCTLGDNPDFFVLNMLLLCTPHNIVFTSFVEPRNIVDLLM